MEISSGGVNLSYCRDEDVCGMLHGRKQRLGIADLVAKDDRNRDGCRSWFGVLQ